MGYSGGKVTKPDSTHDVARALRTADLDLGRLCTHANINVFAKNKPIKMNVLREVTDNERHLHWYGVVLDDNGFWTFDAPRGIAHNEPFRLLDFDGYNANAVAPMFEFYEVPNPINPDIDQLRISPEEFFRKGDQNVELPLNLFPSLYTYTWYIGLLVKNVNTGNMIYFTGENTLEQFFDGETMQTVNVSLENLAANTGDIIEIWVCCAEDSNVEGERCTESMIESGVVQKIAISERCGHALTVANAFSALDLYYLGIAPTVWDMFRPAITPPQYNRSHLTGAAVDLFVDYLFSASETPKIYVELFVDSEVVAHKVMSLGPSVVDSNGMVTVQFTCDKYIEFAQGDTDYPVNFDIAARKADPDGNPVGARQYMWHTYTFDAGLQWATYVAGLQGRDPWSMDELYFVETGDKIESQILYAQTPFIHIDDKSKGKTRRTYTLESPAGYQIYFSVDGNRLEIGGLDNLDEGVEYTFTLWGHIGSARVPSTSRQLKIVYWP